MWVSEKVLQNGKPIARSGRKATGLSEAAGLLKLNLFCSDWLSRSYMLGGERDRGGQHEIP